MSNLFENFADLFAAGIGAISGEELLRRTAERESRKPREVLLAEIEQVTKEYREKQTAEWEKWLKPAIWYPDAVIIEVTPPPTPDERRR